MLIRPSEASSISCDFPGVNLILGRSIPCHSEDTNNVRCTFLQLATPKGKGSLCPYSSSKELEPIARFLDTDWPADVSSTGPGLPHREAIGSMRKGGHRESWGATAKSKKMAETAAVHNGGSEIKSRTLITVLQQQLPQFIVT